MAEPVDTDIEVLREQLEHEQLEHERWRIVAREQARRIRELEAAVLAAGLREPRFALPPQPAPSSSCSGCVAHRFAARTVD